MTVKRPLAKTVLAMFMAIAIIGAVRAEATPIRPDIRKLLQQAPEDTPQFVPARAGWDGPETAKTPESSPNPVLEKFSPAASARAARASLIMAAIPDWRIVLLLALLILALRKFRLRHEAAQFPSIVAEGPEINRAA